MQISFSKLMTWLSRGLFVLVIVFNGSISQAIAENAQLPISLEQLAELEPQNLAQFNGLPIIPLHLISNTVTLTSTHTFSSHTIGNVPKVGIQIGHYLANELPEEQAHLRTGPYATDGSYNEIDINQSVYRALSSQLKQQGVEVDMLPATVPSGYSADVLIALHSDVKSKLDTRGFKLARSRYSTIPSIDDKLLGFLYQNYQQVTGLPRDLNITSNMTGYYIFNQVKYQHSISPSTPSAIIEMGFMSNITDRNFLISQPEVIAKGIANGILEFLKDQKNQLIQPNIYLPILQVANPESDLVPVYQQGKQTPIAYLVNSQCLSYYEEYGNNYVIWLPILNRTGYVKAEQVRIIVR